MQPVKSLNHRNIIFYLKKALQLPRQKFSGVLVTPSEPYSSEEFMCCWKFHEKMADYYLESPKLKQMLQDMDNDDPVKQRFRIALMTKTMSFVHSEHSSFMELTYVAFAALAATPLKAGCLSLIIFIQENTNIVVNCHIVYQSDNQEDEYVCDLLGNDVYQKNARHVDVELAEFYRMCENTEVKPQFICSNRINEYTASNAIITLFKKVLATKNPDELHNLLQMSRVTFDEVVSEINASIENELDEPSDTFHCPCCSVM